VAAGAVGLEELLAAGEVVVLLQVTAAECEHGAGERQGAGGTRHPPRESGIEHARIL
jgi:hypothetical protein